MNSGIDSHPTGILQESRDPQEKKKSFIVVMVVQNAILTKSTKQFVLINILFKIYKTKTGGVDEGVLELICGYNM